VGDLPRDAVSQLFTALGSFKPDFILASNYAGMDAQGLFSQFFEDARIPYVSWFTDTPRMLLYGRDMFVGDYAVAVTWERSYIPHLERAGFRHCHFMPHATDPALFSGTFQRNPARELAFVGMSMITQTAEALEKHGHRPALARAVLEAVAAGRVTRATYAAGPASVLDSALTEGLDESESRNLELFLNYEATRRARAALAEALVPLGLEVRGDDQWRSLVPRAFGTLGYFDDLGPYYGSTGVNVNHTAIQMPCAVNQRVFDCPAAGGFLLTDHQDDMEEHFDVGREAVTYRSFAELRDKAAYYMKHPDERARIVAAAQRRIARQHTHQHRLAKLRDYLVGVYRTGV